MSHHTSGIGGPPIDPIPIQLKPGPWWAISENPNPLACFFIKWIYKWHIQGLIVG